MKTQDILFLIILIVLLVLRRKWLWHTGTVAFVLAGILFMAGNLFTAQRMSWYGAGYMLFAALYNAIKTR